jgi:hypothetical protein
MQRAGIHFMTYKAYALGIEVGAPPESDLFTPRFRYGADEWTHSFARCARAAWSWSTASRPPKCGAPTRGHGAVPERRAWTT